MSDSLYKILDKDDLDAAGGALSDASNIDVSLWIASLFPEGIETSDINGLEQSLTVINNSLVEQASAIEQKQDRLTFTPADADNVYSKSELDSIFATQSSINENKQDKLNFTPADAADTYTKGEVDAAFDALPDPPAVPTFATEGEVRAGNVDGKIISPKVMADALATVTVMPATATAGMDFSGFINAEIALTGNLTVGPPSGGFARKTGEIDFVQDATGGRTVAFHADYIVPANFSLQATANGRTSVPYRYQANGKVRLYSPSKWSA